MIVLLDRQRGAVLSEAIFSFCLEYIRSLHISPALSLSLSLSPFTSLLAPFLMNFLALHLCYLFPNPLPSPHTTYL